MPSAYKRATSQGGIWFLIVLAGIVPGMSVPYLLRDNKEFGAWILIFMSAPILTAMIIGWIVCSKLTKKRHHGIANCLESFGFNVKIEPKASERNTFYEPISYLTETQGLENSGGGIRWIASQSGPGGDILAFEHVYNVDRHKQNYDVEHTIIAYSAELTDPPGAALGHQPGLSLRRPHRTEKRSLEQRWPDVKIGDPDFDTDWVINGDSETAHRFLNDLVRSRLKESPRGEVWFIGAGWVACCFRGLLDQDGIRTFVTRSREVLALTS